MNNSDKISNRELFDRAFDEGIKSILPDIFFMFLPLIVIILVNFFHGGNKNIFSYAEWSFASAVLSGQSIVQIVYAITKCQVRLKSSEVSIIMSAIIVFVLVPNLIILVFMVITDPLPWYLLTIQMFLFIVSMAIFIFVGAAKKILDNSEV